MAETKNKYQQKLKVLNKLFEAGCGSEKELQEMSLEKILAIRGINMQDMAVIAELQKQVKGNHLFSYLAEVYRLEGKGEMPVAELMEKMKAGQENGGEKQC